MKLRRKVKYDIKRAKSKQESNHKLQRKVKTKKFFISVNSKKPIKK